MDSTTLSLCLLVVHCFSIVTQAYDFIDAPFELNKLGVVASFPDSGETGGLSEKKKSGSPQQKEDVVPVSTTPSPMEVHGRQAPLPTTPTPVDDFHFSNDDYIPVVGLQTDDKFNTGPQEDMRLPYGNNEDSFATSKVDGYIMVDGKMQRFTRATASIGGHPVTDHSTVLKPVTLYMPTSRISTVGEPEMTAVQGYVIGRQGSVVPPPGVQGAPGYGGHRKEYMFVYPEKQYANSLYNVLHMPFTTPPSVKRPHPLFNKGKGFPEMVFAERISPEDDYRIPSGEEDAVLVKPHTRGQTYRSADPNIHINIPVVAQPYQVEGRQSGRMYNEEPMYNSQYPHDNTRSYNEESYRRARPYDNNHDRAPSYSSYDANPRYNSNNSPSYGDSQAYDNEHSYGNAQASYEHNPQDQTEPSYREQSYNQQPSSQQAYPGNQKKNQGTFIQHGPPISRFIPYLNLNGNLIPQFKNGRYQTPSFDVSDSKQGRLPRRNVLLLGKTVPVVPYEVNAKNIVIICPRVPDSFCKKSGHFGHPTHPSCFVQCDERGVPFVKTCPNDTEWRPNTAVCA